MDHRARKRTPLKRRVLRGSMTVLGNQRGEQMNFKLVIAGAWLAMTLVAPVAAQAQGVPGGVAYGVYEGNRRAGPVGAVVGGAVGGVMGGVEGVLGVDRKYDPYYSERPAANYRQRRVVRSKIK